MAEKVPKLSALADLGDDELALLAESSVVQEFDDGARIVTEGEQGDGLYVIESGVAEVLQSKGNDELVIAKLHPGDHFGEMSLVRESPISASVRARRPVQCRYYPRDAFLAVLEANPDLGRKVLWSMAHTLSGRLETANRRYARLLGKRQRAAALRHLFTLAWVEFRMVAAYLWMWFRKKIRLPHSAARRSRIHRRHARRFKEAAFKLKGVNIKIGQLASLQAHLLPKEYLEEFRDMRDRAPPTDYPLVAGVIQSELGAGPLELFDDFEKTPVAAASMAQVHIARLKSGEKVAVKILHPGLEQSVAIDLWLLRVMLGFLRLFVKKPDLRQIYREAETPLRNELNLLHEAEATEELGRALHPLGVKVPEIYWRYSTRRMLTLEFVDGVSVADRSTLDEWQVDRKALMETYLRAFLQQAFEGGYFHCDPHPANVFCSREGQLVLLDFGMVKRLPETVRVGLLKECLGGLFNNGRLYADGIIERGIVDESEREVLETFAADVFSDPKMRSIAFDHDITEDGDVVQLFGKIGGLLKGLKTFQTPQDQLMFLRALGIVIDVCKEVYPEMPVSEQVMPAVMPLFGRFLAEHPQYAPSAPNP